MVPLQRKEKNTWVEFIRDCYLIALTEKYWLAGKVKISFLASNSGYITKTIINTIWKLKKDEALEIRNNKVNKIAPEQNFISFKIYGN